MIKNFAHKGLENFFYDGSTKGIQPQHAQKIADILDRLDASKRISDMRTRKRPPTHPGGVLKRHYLDPLSLSISNLSSTLGVSRKTLSKIVNERGSITPDMALRLSKAFNTTPELWLNLQQNHDLWHASQKSKDWQRVEAVAV